MAVDTIDKPMSFEHALHKAGTQPSESFSRMILRAVGHYQKLDAVAADRWMTALRKSEMFGGHTRVIHGQDRSLTIDTIQFDLRPEQVVSRAAITLCELNYDNGAEILPRINLIDVYTASDIFDKQTSIALAVMESRSDADQTNTAYNYYDSYRAAMGYGEDEAVPAPQIAASR